MAESTRALRADAELLRAIGLFGLTAGIVNVTIGGGIYRLPAAAAQGLGPAAPLAYVACATALLAIVVCFADAGGRVSLTGGIYAYVEVAFGPLVGLVTGIVLWASLTATFAAVVSFLADAFASLLPALGGPVPRAFAIALVLGAMAALNVRGVRVADRFNAVATVLKVSPLILLLIAGAAAVDPANLRVAEWPDASAVASTSAILVFAFLGVETALVPSGEIVRPERTVPRAVFLAIGIVTVIYICVHLVAQGILGPALGAQKMPLAEAAGIAVGGWARGAVVAASVVSMLIYASGMMLGVPRLLFAFGRDGFFPRGLAAVHAGYRTPHVAILTQAALVAALAISGTFERLALLGNAAALMSYACCCAAAWQLRRKDVRMTEARYEVPGAAFSPPVALVFIAWLLTGMTRTEWLATAAVAAIAAVVYFARRGARA